MADIFISYAREDLSRIQPLANALEGLGWTVFWDLSIPPGKPWRESIATALSSAHAVLVAWSKASVDSDWVIDEAEVGRKRRILFPVFLDEVEAPLGFRSLQAIDLIGWDGGRSSPEFQRLVSSMSKFFVDSSTEINAMSIESSAVPSTKAQAWATGKMKDTSAGDFMKSNVKKWLTGVLSAIIVAAIIGGASALWRPDPVSTPLPELLLTKIVDVPVNIYAAHDAEGNRPGLDTHDSEHQTHDPEIGKRIIDAKVIDNPFASEFVDGGKKVSPNGNKITLNLKLTDAARRRWSAGGDAEKQKGPVFAVRVLVTHEK
jgi:hypothetical protein